MSSKFRIPVSEKIDFAFYPTIPTISLELTNNCNLKCPYCANITLTRPKTYIEWPLLEKIVDECAERRVNLGWLHGVGEPLLWDRLEEVVALIKKKGAGAGSFGTNGTLLTAERVRRLLGAGLDSIYVSIDTLDPEIYKNTRGGKIEKVVSNVQELIRIVPRTFGITIALMEHRDQHRTDEISDEFFRTFGRHDNVKLQWVKNMLFPSAPGDYRVEQRKVERCFSPTNYLFIALDGRAAICCMDQDVVHSLGNVRERSIHDIWFDCDNQTTFRNIALGVFKCPDVCTKQCILKEPKQDPKMFVSEGFGWPYVLAEDHARSLMRSGDQAGASRVLKALLIRDPWNEQTQQLLSSLQSA